MRKQHSIVKCIYRYQHLFKNEIKPESNTNTTYIMGENDVMSMSQGVDGNAVVKMSDLHK